MNFESPPELAAVRACAYARERVIFERTIGANQGVQFPLARAHAAIEAAALVRSKAALPRSY